jgi:hypothetical protein
MGLITGLVTLPLAPVRGVAWIAERLAEEAERELYDEGRIMSELAALEELRNRGELSEERFDRGVADLLERLELGRQLELERRSYGG